MKRLNPFLSLSLICLLVCAIGSTTYAQQLEELLHDLQTCHDVRCRNEKVYAIGLYYQHNSSLSQALNYYHQFALEQETDTVLIIDLLKNRARCAASLERQTEAISTLETCLRYLPARPGAERSELLERLVELNVYGNRDFGKAIGYALELANFYQSKRNYAALAQAYNVLGFTYRKRKADSLSAHYYDLCYELLRTDTFAIGKKDRIKLLLNFGVLFTERGDLEQALDQFKDALSLSDATADPVLRVSILNYVSTFYIKTGAYRLAEQHLQQAIVLLNKSTQDLSAKRVLMRTYELNSEVLLKENRMREYRAQMAQVNRVKDQILKAEQMQNKILYENVLAAEKKEWELKLLQKQSALQEAELQRARLVQTQLDQQLTIRQTELELARQHSRFYQQQNQLKDYQLKNDLLREADMKHKLNEALKAQQDAANKQLVDNLLRDQEISRLKIREKELEVLAERRKNVFLIVSSILTFLGVAVLIYLVRKINRKRRIMVAQKAQIETQNQELQEKNYHLQDLFNELQERNHDIQEIQKEIMLKNDSLQQLNESLEEKVRQRTADLVTTNEELIRRVTQIEEFTAIISHNIRGPIARILGLSNIMDLQKPVDDPRLFMELKSRLVESTYEADRVLKDLQLILEVKATLTENFECVEVEDAYQEAVTRLGQLSPEIRIYYSTSEPLRIWGMKNYLVSIFSNLLTNAIKFRTPSQPADIFVKVFYQSNRVWIKVTDNGIGFNVQALEGKVFKMYQKFHPQTEGKGLGLYLAKNQVEAMRGRISIESAEQKGTSVVIDFPSMAAVS